jgi:uncharacterized YigZ family protein
VKTKDIAILLVMITSYRTIQTPSEGHLKEKGSKFHAFAFPVKDEDEIKAHLQGLRKKYFDATHHCYAYVLGAERKIFRAVDDGEPGHSAGTPILNQIKSKEITNVLVVVVRYFGGTKLGVGGLVQAYKSATEEALNRADIIEVAVTSTMLLEYDFNFTSTVMRLVKDFELVILSENYQSHAQLRTEVKLKWKEKLIEKLNLLAATGTPITFVEIQ